MRSTLIISILITATLFPITSFANGQKDGEPLATVSMPFDCAFAIHLTTMKELRITLQNPEANLEARLKYGNYYVECTLDENRVNVYFAPNTPRALGGGTLYVFQLGNFELIETIPYR